LVGRRRKIGVAHRGSLRIKQSHSESSDITLSNAFSSRNLPKAMRKRRLSMLRNIITYPT
jgi:hypothetical protein